MQFVEKPSCPCPWFLAQGFDENSECHICEYIEYMAQKAMPVEEAPPVLETQSDSEEIITDGDLPF